jgi:hypothetical protein
MHVMGSKRLVCITAAFLFSRVYAAVEHDRVTTLPGYEGDLPSKHYSGYVNVSLPDQDRVANVHYWFAENAKGDPKAPTVLWLQGGPGKQDQVGQSSRYLSTVAKRHSNASPNVRMYANGIYLAVLLSN